MITIKADPRMKKALEKLAEKQFISMSAVIKQAVENHLKDHGLDWRDEGED